LAEIDLSSQERFRASSPDQSPQVHTGTDRALAYFSLPLMMAYSELTHASATGEG